MIVAKPQIEGIKACVFDAYGTIFNVHAPIAKLSARIGENAGEVSRLWRQKQLEYTWLRSMMPAHIDFWEITGDALDYALETHGISDGGLRKDLMRLYLTLDAYDDAVPALGVLRDKGLQTAILSNGSPNMLQAAAAHAGIAPLLDANLSIETVGIFKPSPNVYQLVLDTMDLEPEEVNFVSTNGWDAAAAAYFGFQVVWMNRFDVPWERLPGEPKAIISGLAELPPLLN